jgi:hypothetical protein
MSIKLIYKNEIKENKCDHGLSSRNSSGHVRKTSKAAVKVAGKVPEIPTKCCPKSDTSRYHYISLLSCT